MTASATTRQLQRLAALLALAGAGALAQEVDLPASPPASPVPAPESEPEPVPAPVPSPMWEGAIGLTAAYRPEYQGAAKTRVSVTPALFLRYGRFTITNASGFVTKRAEDVVRGLALDLVQSDRLHVNAGLRFDGGRSESGSADLEGMGDIDPTVRARLTVDYRLNPVWRAGFSWSADALARGGGNFGDINLGWEHRFRPDRLLRVGASLSAAGDRYMQTYYGVTPEQSARTGYPVYTPPAGLRDMSANVNWRQEIDDDWILLAGAGVSRLLGPAASSPLTRSPSGWGVNAGLARRF